MRRTQIVVTLGPKSWSREVIRGMIQAGADVMRLNLSHVRSVHDYRFLSGVVRAVREIAKEVGRLVGVMVDTPGHKFRLGEFIEREVRLGDALELTSSADLQNGEIYFPNQDYLSLMRVGQEVVIGDGFPRFRVVQDASPNVLCKVSLAGLLEPFKGLTVRGGLRIGDLNLSPLTEKDERGFQFAVEVGADQVVMSYGTSANQLIVFTKRYRELGGTGRVLFKYELGEAGDDLEAIVQASDGGFVGQGDLGLSIPSEEVPKEAERVVLAYRNQDKSCIVGTQLLSSMKSHPFPTHGERAGIYFNVMIGATALMVSDETSIGDFPMEVVEVLARNIRAAEKI